MLLALLLQTAPTVSDVRALPPARSRPRTEASACSPAATTAPWRTCGR
jgi:hypothetical protein